MADLLSAAERALATHDGFERRDEEFVATSTPFEATVQLKRAGSGVRYVVEMALPTLDAVVADESVATVVQAGWFETLERRLEDLDGALRNEPSPPSVVLDEGSSTVTVEVSFESDRPDVGADDAAALVGYVEGTYVEGVIPGYTYRDPVNGLLERAYERSGTPTED